MTVAAKRVGGEVVAFCTKCRMDLAHTIIAMDGTKPARVQCNTCNGQHNYRGKAEAAAKAPKAPKAAKVEVPTETQDAKDAKAANLEKLRAVTAKMKQKAAAKKVTKVDPVEKELGSTGEVATSFSIDSNWDSVDGIDLKKIL